MGLFSSIKKGIKKVFKGVGKVFKAIAKPFKKLLSNKWVGYALTAIAVVSGGIAIANGITQGISAFSSAASQAAAAGKAAPTFLGKLGTAAKAFGKGVVSGISSPIETGKDLLGKAQTGLNAGGSVGAADQIGGSVAKEAAAQAAGSEGAKAQVLAGNAGGRATGYQGGTTAANSTAAKAAASGARGSAAGATSSGGVLGTAAKIGKGVMDYAKSPGGGMLIGGMGSNYFGAKAQLEAEEEERERKDRMWRDFIQERERDYRPTRIPGAFARASGRLRDRASDAYARNDQRTEAYQRRFG